jgi:hypothetical protein
METTANANTPLFRFGSNAATLIISNTVFGPSMASAGHSGGTIITYTSKTGEEGAEENKGSIMLNGSAATVSVSNSYKTDFDWTKIGTGETTYPIDGLESVSVDETKLFKAPSDGDYSIQYSFNGAKNAGALKWRMP